MKIPFYFLLLGLTSCTSTIIYDKFTDRPERIPMRGTFLLNVLDVPVDVSDAPASERLNMKLTKITLNQLHKIWGDSVTYITSTPSPGISLNPIPYTLDDTLRNSTDYHYLIHISATTGNTERRIDSWDGTTYSDNYTTVGIIIFDIDKNTRAYDQVVRGTEAEGEDDAYKFGWFHLSIVRSNKNILKNTLIRTLRDLNQHVNKTQRQQLRNL